MSSEPFLYGCLATLAMGDTQAVTLAQTSHLSLALRSGSAAPSNLIALGGPIPRGPDFVGIVIDDYVALSLVPSGAKGASNGAALSKAMETKYLEVGLVSHPEKGFEDDSKPSFWGVDIDGQKGLIRGTLKRAIPLFGILLQVVKLGYVSDAQTLAARGSLDGSPDPSQISAEHLGGVEPAERSPASPTPSSDTQLPGTRERFLHLDSGVAYSSNSFVFNGLFGVVDGTDGEFVMNYFEKIWTKGHVLTGKDFAWPPIAPGFLDLFSGSKGVASWLLRFTDSWVVTYELEDGPDQDLDSEECQKELMRLLALGVFQSWGGGHQGQEDFMVLTTLHRSEALGPEGSHGPDVLVPKSKDVKSEEHGDSLKSGNAKSPSTF
ncbi:Ultraviolet-B receptor UVR8 [Durusdinium trenchii]|uniref:Ultraviolet-B receptor UVR8 n=1 Tax=Durusdinium trenchii TaxID=1381693 RepID=A0ABP0J432_9DINO